MEVYQSESVSTNYKWPHKTTQAIPVYTFYRKMAERTGVQIIQTFRFKDQTIFPITLFIQHKECH